MNDVTHSPDDLGVLDPAPRRVTLSSGLAVDVTPITVRQLVPFVRALGPARDAMADGDVDLWDLIADYGEDLQEAVAVALALPLSAVSDLLSIDFLDCLNAVMEINRDFFASWLLAPTMKAARIRATGQPEDGQMSYMDSSQPGTAARM